MTNSSRRIEICGGIASGKTTIASLMPRLGYDVVNESFSINPFWKSFYTDPSKYAFETEVTFTLQHYHQIKKQTEKSNKIACDYSFELDAAYAEIGLKNSKLEAFKTVYKEIKKELSPPVLIIHLQCDPKVELTRILARGRDIEKNITVDFLHSLNEAISLQINKTKNTVPILKIDSAKYNFADDEETKRAILKMVTDALEAGGIRL